MVSRYPSRIFASSLINMPVVQNGIPIGICRDLGMSNKGREVVCMIHTTGNGVIEIPLERIELNSGALVVK